MCYNKKQCITAINKNQCRETPSNKNLKEHNASSNCEVTSDARKSSFGRNQIPWAQD